MTQAVRRQYLYDALALGLSLLCLVHCLVLPMLILLLPVLAAYLAVPEQFHLWALALAIPASTIALAAGYRRHRQSRPAKIVVPGIALLAFGALAAPTEAMEAALTVPGALALALGHALNWRALRHGDGPHAVKR
ncbi:MerC family mercury resistance protein [Sphingomonas hengshuiensis]|uniref:MerC mercury resistance protein n=1 Tax=Sphingomonas hengshuiensis TaxID=1609977 RepID=A0A7U5BE83_9SPHN|nr:MerC family mercury resistance protein [Sphingomonas hengshuiensis]AJP70688.1 MerC mercury resistance protein [Sphingomonas hengshuiensis]